VIWQPIATALVVLGALAYLVYKVGFASRARRASARPDVPLSRLRKGKRRGSSCHHG
jgi:hypothetical protein